MRTIIIFSIIILRLCLRTRSYGDGQLDTSKLEQDEHGVTSLISSARFGNLTRVKEILRDANLPSSYKDHQDGSGQTALIAAVRNLHFLVAKYLISAGVNINIYDKEKMTALSCASSRGLTSIVVDLLDRGGDPSIPDQDGWIALTHASNNGHAVVVWYLLKTNVDVNQREPQDGLTPLCLASANGHDDVVKVLLQNGGLVNKTDRDLKTPLMHSVINGHGTIAKHLLEAGAHTDAISKKRGETALMFAAYTGNSEMVKLLLEHGASPHIRQKKTGATALMLATALGDLISVQLLLGAGSDPHLKRDHKTSALDIAMKNNRVDLIEILNKTTIPSTAGPGG